MPIAMRRYQKAVLWFIIIPILLTFSIGTAIFSCSRQMGGGGGLAVTQ